MGDGRAAVRHGTASAWVLCFVMACDGVEGSGRWLGRCFPPPARPLADSLGWVKVIGSGLGCVSFSRLSLCRCRCPIDRRVGGWVGAPRRGWWTVGGHSTSLVGSVCCAYARPMGGVGAAPLSAPRCLCRCSPAQLRDCMGTKRARSRTRGGSRSAVGCPL